MYQDPNMQGQAGMYQDPNMQGQAGMYQDPNMQGQAGMYQDPNMQGQAGIQQGGYQQYDPYGQYQDPNMAAQPGMQGLDPMANATGLSSTRLPRAGISSTRCLPTRPILSTTRCNAAARRYTWARTTTLDA